jgi:N-acetylglucosaminyl-diphospho-decaprenol L-rhamnosyltransferase
VTITLSVVVLSWNTVDLTLACLRSLFADGTALRREIILVDNASEDDTVDRVAAEFPQVRLVRNATNLLFSAGNNVGANAATGEFLCLLNSDTEVRPGALDRLVAWLREHPDHAMVGPKFVFPDGRLQTSCRRLPRLREHVAEWSWFGTTRPARRLLDRVNMADFDHLTSRDVEQPLGACILMRRAEYLELGGLDPRLSLFFNDVDLCLRLRQRGRKSHYLVEATVLHHEGASTKKKHEEFGNPLWFQNRLEFYRKHRGPLARGVLRAMLTLSMASMFGRVLLGRRSWSQKKDALGRLRSFARRCHARPV